MIRLMVTLMVITMLGVLGVIAADGNKYFPRFDGCNVAGLLVLGFVIEAVATMLYAAIFLP